ncbi:MAG: 3-hydroxyacyl-ACP dehydratase FabZ [Syntrophobacteraceae bacterium]|jgi:beta-hydroxyacyl-ACP dehydratase FabZ|nr:3-hydroxyacyl-ACP dehydratase FabZ [Syntrophobacteraceae bacterium]
MMLDIQKILEKLPHRYPFILLDRILEAGPQEIVGLKNVTINEPFFQGHFPGHPIMPAVLIIEALAQAGGLLAFALAPDTAGNNVYFMGVDKARFRKPVRPGDQLILKIKLIKQRGSIFKMRGEAFVDGQLVAEGELMATTDPGGPDSSS